VPFEFPLYQAVGAVLVDLGVPEVQALRGLSLALFTVSGWLLFLLLQRLTDGATALVGLVFFLFSPLAFVWSRAVLIEFLAVAATLAWVLLAWRAPERRSVGLIIAVVGALAAGVLAMLTKPTTALWWAAPIIVGVVCGVPRPSGSRLPGWSAAKWRLMWAALSVAVPLMIGYAWTRHADRIKAASEATAWLTSEALREWNFGSVLQRLDASAWGEVLRDLVLTVTGVLGLVAAAGLVVGRGRIIPTHWAVMATAPLTVFTFWNLYVVHDYYWAAVAPGVAVAMATGCMALIRVFSSRHEPIVAGACLVAWLVTALMPVTPLVALPFTKLDPGLAIGGIPDRLASLSRPSERSFITGLDWDPTLLYLADRRGLMLTDHLPEGVEGRQPDLDQYRFAVVWSPEVHSLGATTVRRWAAPVDGHIYQLSDSPDELRGHAVLFSGSDALPPFGVPPTEAGRRVSCAEATEVLGGLSGHVWLRLSGIPTDRLRVGDDLAPVPGDAAVVLLNLGELEADLAVTCSDGVGVTAIGVVPPQWPGWATADRQ
jgi:hypothetical protein